MAFKVTGDCLEAESIDVRRADCHLMSNIIKRVMR